MNARLARWFELLRRIEPSPRGKKLMAWVGYPLFGLVVALLTLLLSVPQDRVKDRLETALSADVGTLNEPMALGMDVTIGELSVTLLSGLGFRADNMILRSRPLNPAEKPARYIVDDVRVHLGLFGLIGNHPTYRFKGHALGGAAAGVIDNSLEESHAKIEIDKMSLANLPGLPLPLDGTLVAKLDVDLPKNLVANANGSIELELDNTSLGDGKAKLTVPNDPFLSQGVTIPRVRLGKLSGQVVIEKGRARFDNVRAHSADADATLEGYVELHDPIASSMVHAYLKFRPAEALTKREGTIDLLVTSLAQTARRADGYLGVQITGPLMALSYLPSKDPPFGVTSRSEPTPVAGPPPVPAPPPTGMPVTPLPSPPPVNEQPQPAPPSGAPSPPAPSVPPSGAPPAVPPPPPSGGAPLPGAMREPPGREPPREGAHEPAPDRPGHDREEPAQPPMGGRAPRPTPEPVEPAHEPQ